MPDTYALTNANGNAVTYAVSDCPCTDCDAIPHADCCAVCDSCADCHPDDAPAA